MVYNSGTKQITPFQAAIDLLIFFTLMFLVRTVYLEFFGFWGNALFKSIATVGTATVLLYFRKETWKKMGLLKPKSYLRVLLHTVIALIGSVVSILLFEMFFRDLFTGNADSGNSLESSFIMKEGNLTYFFSVIVFVWIESFLEELQDRGFSLNRLDALFSKFRFSTIVAVLFQAAIFGFRHSYDFSPRSVTTGLIGLVFGIVYVVSGRNLWPLILAHVFLNTMSMVEKM